MSEEKKTPSMKSGSDDKDSKGNSSSDEKDKKNASDSSSDDSSDSKHSNADKGSGEYSKSGGSKDSKGGAESKADAKEKSSGGSGGKSSGLAVGDAAGVYNDGKESKGGADTKANEEMSGNKKGGILGGGSSGKKKSIPQRLASLGSKISLALHAALTAFKTMVVMQLLAMLQALMSAIATAITTLVTTLMTAITTAVTAVATVLGVSVAVAAVAVIGGVVGVVALVAVVVVGVIVNNTAVKDDVLPCPEVNLEYMEVPDGIPTQAWTNAKLIYTFFKSYGEAVAEATGNPDDSYTDEMIAGILGNWYTESKIDTTAVETVFDEPYAIGPKKMFLWQGGVDITWDYHEEDWSYTDPVTGETSSGTSTIYDGTIIDPYYEFSSTVGFLGSPDDTTTIYDYYDYHGYGVSKDNPVNHEPIMFEVKWIQDLYEPSYWDSYPAIEYMGLGLGQWTNGRNTELLEYADDNNREWYDLDLQLMYCLTEPAGSFFINWKGEQDITSYTSIEGTTYSDGMVFDGEVMDSAAEIASATEDFFVDWEAGGTGNAAASNSADARINNALLWFNIIKEWREDVDYVLGTGSSLWNTLASASAIASDVTQSGNAADCNNLKFMGNASLAEAMVSFAWAPDKDDHNDGTRCWRHLHNTLAPGDQYKRSCDRTVCIGVWWSGTDSSYLLGSTFEQLDYLVKKSVQYELMLSSGTTAGMTSDTAWWKEVDMSSAGTVDEFVALLQPGDVLIRNDRYEGLGDGVGHTLVYVGSETVLRRWPDADPAFCIVHGSINQRSPGTDKFGAGGGGANDYTTYRVFRNMKKYCADEYKSRVAVTCAGHSNEEQ